MKKLFTASKAIEIANNANGPDVDYEAQCVLESIKYEAGRGKYEYNVHYILRGKTIQTLLDLGYVVREHSAGAISNNGLYYTIKWGI